MSDEFPEVGARSPQSLGGAPVSIHLYAEDADAIFNQAVHHVWPNGSSTLDPAQTITVKLVGYGRSGCNDWTNAPPHTVTAS